MTTVALTGGLGNRMFQYAFGYALKKQGLKVLYDDVHYKRRTDCTWEFVDLKDVFPHLDISYTAWWNFYFTFPQKYKSFPKRLFNRLMLKSRLESVVKGPSLHYVPKIKEKARRNTLFYGHWQSEQYFADCRDEILEQFTFLPFSERQNIDLAKQMKKENSVAIHIRKGEDYYRWKSTHGICDADYYRKAIDYIKKTVDNPVFYVFTDNIPWVRENLATTDIRIVDWNPLKGRYNFRDMQLMSCAKHNIIANSTYSWWGAWLNTNPTKIVIAPKEWVNNLDPKLQNNDVVPESWVRL